MSGITRFYNKLPLGLVTGVRPDVVLAYSSVCQSVLTVAGWCLWCPQHAVGQLKPLRCASSTKRSACRWCCSLAWEEIHDVQALPRLTTSCVCRPNGART